MIFWKQKLSKMNCKLFFSLLLFALVLFNCKKTHLVGKFSNLSGQWKWSDGYDDNGKTSFILTLESKGEYKLCDNSKKLEYGRLIKSNGTIKFKSDNIFKSLKTIYLNGRDIKSFTGDSLIITKINFTDQPISIYKKTK